MVAAAHLTLLLAPQNILLNILVVLIRAVASAPLAAFFNGIMADVAEFGQWKSHQRQESLICSASSVGYKVGCGLIMSLITTLLGVAGFVSSTSGGAAQSLEAVSMVKNLYIWAPVFAYIVEAFICSRFYLEDKLPGIMEELRERELAGQM